MAANADLDAGRESFRSKLDVGSRSAATAYAYEHNLVQRSSDTS